MSLEPITVGDRIVAVRLAGQRFDCEPETPGAYIPKKLLHGFRLSEIPPGLIIKPVDSISNGTVKIRNNIAMIRFIDGSANVSVEIMEKRRYWDGDIGLTPYIEGFRSAVRGCEHTKEADFQDDGDNIFLTYEIEIREDLDIRAAIKHAEAVIKEVEERAGQLGHRTKDGLTGLLDRKAFDVDLTYALQRPRSEVGLILVDLDHFKKVNDNHGHLIGDEVLREVAAVLSEDAERNGAQAYRYGGEELAAIRVGFDRDSLETFAEHVRIAVQKLVIKKEPSLRITTSIGFALAPEDGQTTSDLINGADKALYRAKKEGRNRARGSRLTGKQRDRSPVLIWAPIALLIVTALLVFVVPLIRTNLGLNKSSEPTGANKAVERQIGVDSVKALPVPSKDQGKPEPLPPPKESSSASSAIGALSVLGWQVQPGEGNRLQFSDIYKHISIRQSAPYFCALNRPFNVSIVGARSLEGLSDLRNAKQLVRFDLNGAEISDLSEVRYLHNIQIFVMGQTAGHISDLSPLKDLANLRELGLDSPAIRDLTPIRDLTRITTLSIGGTQVSDLSPLHNFRHLSSLNLGGAPVADLSPLADLDALKSMQITGTEVPALVTLVHKENLKSLAIFTQRTVVDLSPVAELSGLEKLDLNFFDSQGFDISSVRQLKNLQTLSIDGNGFEYYTLVNGLDAIGALANLKKLNIFGLQISDLNFAATLQNLTELSVTNAPLSNISAVGQLKSLESLSLTGTLVVDISPLLNISKLRQLGIVRTPARSDVVSELELRGVKIQR